MSPPAAMLPDPDSTLEVTPAEVAAWIGLAPDERPRLIDCREREEIAICRIEGHEWIPLGTIPSALEKFSAEAHRGFVIYCHHGMRSLRAASFLRAHGIHRAFSMSGGIEAWSCEIDPDVPRY